ncbi:MAG: lipopolysaccharide biosynthesis protein, partial [Bacteroidales bacterium]|nr:lipopolysaccharide biosynthesis protein [Bacteroidales bacterium]
MFVNLFTSRIILDVLGVEDFGIYNLIGGFVAMFAIVRSGLVSSTQRFLTYDLGKNDIVSLNRTFSTITIIYIFLCSIIFILSESFGIWFIDNKLVIPDDRLGAAKWVFQFSVISLIANLLSSPYNALIIAHEKMEAFAYITIYEVIAKLIVTCLLYIVNVDKLIVYAVLQCIVQVTVPILYWCYCQKNYKAEVRIKWKFDVKKVGEIYAFAGWSMMGGFAYMGYTQGLTILLGAFF